jgi:hypothetical protein
MGTGRILDAACPHCVSGAAPALAPAFYFQGLGELEGERGFRGEGDIAVESEASAASARGAFTLAGTVLGRRGGLDIVVLVLDGDAGQGQREHCAAFESSSGLGVFYETGSASPLRDGEPAVDLDWDLDSGGKCLPGSTDLRADSLIKEDRNDRLGRDNQWPRRWWWWWRARVGGRGRGLICRRRRGVIRVSRRNRRR